MKKKPKVFVTGASGFIGSRLCHCALKNCYVEGTFLTNMHVRENGCSYYKLDVRNHNDVQLLIKSIKPDVVVHIAGTKDIQFCEKNPDIAMHVHRDATRNIAIVCKNINSRLIYISTDCVFGGEKEKYIEDDSTGPINVYGRVKLGGEKAILSTINNAVIIRASLLFGWNNKQWYGRFF